jgi:hypothetical protein
LKTEITEAAEANSHSQKIQSFCTGSSRLRMMKFLFEDSIWAIL